MIHVRSVPSKLRPNRISAFEAADELFLFPRGVFLFLFQQFSIKFFNARRSFFCSYTVHLPAAINQLSHQHTRDDAEPSLPLFRDHILHAFV